MAAAVVDTSTSPPTTTFSSIEDDYDPTVRSCGWCYLPLLLENETKAATSNTTPTSIISCPRCPRLYCSQACCNSDFRTHEFWCSRGVGEKGIDFEVCRIAGKGMGVRTKRAFERGDKILVERPVMTTSNAYSTTTKERNTAANSNQNHFNPEETIKTNESIRVAAMSLTPIGGDLEDKLAANGVSLGPQQQQSEQPKNAAGLFLTFSRVNHDCLGNADHYFDHQHGVVVLLANDTIPADTEVTFPYTRTGKDRLSDLDWRGFRCTCDACESPALGLKVNQMSALDTKIVALGGHPCANKRAEAVQMAHTLLELYDEVNASCRDYARIHYDLFQILIAQQHSIDEANHHMVQAYQYALSFCGYEDHETVAQYKEYVDHPELHTNYRMID